MAGRDRSSEMKMKYWRLKVTNLLSHLAVPVPVDWVPGPEGGTAQQPPLGQIHAEDALTILQKLRGQRDRDPDFVSWLTLTCMGDSHGVCLHTPSSPPFSMTSHSPLWHGPWVSGEKHSPNVQSYQRALTQTDIPRAPCRKWTDYKVYRQLRHNFWNSPLW